MAPWNIRVGGLEEGKGGQERTSMRGKDGKVQGMKGHSKWRSLDFFEVKNK